MEDIINEPGFQEKLNIIMEKKRLEHHHSGAGGHHHHSITSNNDQGVDENTDPIDVESFLNDPSQPNSKRHSE